MARRAAGLLLHPTSLPGPFGVGDLGPAAEAFCLWAAEAGQRLWQVLPLCPTDAGGSPYSGLSAFAGNPLLISPQRLVDEGLLPAEALEEAFEPRGGGHVDFVGAGTRKERLLRLAWERFQGAAGDGTRRDWEAFRAEEAGAGWLDDWTLFASLKRRLAGCDWTAWDAGLRRRETAALAAARSELEEEIAYHAFVQFLFFRHWTRLRRFAEGLGIRILGDLPIYMAHDSADVWARQDLYALDSEGLPEKVAGVPPDYFSEAGQLWGNPLYRWERMEAEGFAWWVARFRMNLRLAHLVRLDHFRGFVDYWEVPASEKTARHGRWVSGPGSALFAAAERARGEMPVIAEDLGLITPEVHRLRAELGLPGMRVLQFGFGDLDSAHLPHHHEPRSVVYTGTHDNDTARGWFSGLAPEIRARVLDYLGCAAEDIAWAMVRAAHASVAELAVVPVQDVFDLGGDARLNVPGEARGNWTWRAEEAQFTPARAARLRRLAELTGRLG